MSDDQPIALLLTHCQDYYAVDLVGETLRRLGVRPVRIDTDLPVSRSELSFETDGNGESHSIVVADEVIDARSVCAVWTRQIRAPATDDQLQAEYRDGCTRNVMTARDGFFGALEHARWVNGIGGIRTASNKIHQLRTARATGLRVPVTLVTNSPARARAFFDAHGGNVVAKLLVNLSTSMERASFFVRTTNLTEQHLNSLDSLRHCPMIFQKRLAKKRELRVAYVAGEAFVGAIRASDLPDWRLGSPEEIQWSRGDLSDATLVRLRSLMDKLGLVYGAIDLIESDSGPPVFLEVNPTGEWGMLQKSLDLPIAEALAKALIGPEARS